MNDYTVSITESDRIRMSTLYSYFPNTPRTTIVRLLFDSLHFVATSYPKYPAIRNATHVDNRVNSHGTYDLQVFKSLIDVNDLAADFEVRRSRDLRTLNMFSTTRTDLHRRGARTVWLPSRK